MLAPACGPAREPAASETANESTSSAPSDTTTTATSSTDVTTTTSTSDSTASASSSSDADSTTGVDACTPFHSTPPEGDSVTLVIRHEGTTPVFFASAGGCGATEPLVITAESDGSTIEWLTPSACSPWECDGLIGEPECYLGCPGCVSPDHGRLDPGALQEPEWTGRRLTAMEMSSECSPGTDCQRPCWRVDPTPAGAYEVSLTVYRSCTGNCGCEGDDDGHCNLFEAESLADPVTFSASLEYPAQTSVEITITD